MTRRHRAFVSSTFEDLSAHREFVIRSLREAGVDVDPMEDWQADSREPRQFSVERMAGCDVCVLLVAFRRGTIPAGQDRSITQLEYDYAVQNGIDVLAFLLDDEALWYARFDDRGRDEGIVAWRQALRARHGTSFFSHDPASIRMAEAVARWLAARDRVDPMPRLAFQQFLIGGDLLSRGLHASRDARQAQPSRLLQAHNAFIPLIGREAELEGLTAFLSVPGAFRWRVCFGEAGMGKTRLATEFIHRATALGWCAGFLNATKLHDLNSEVVHEFVPDKPTLAVVDYAASKVAGLRRLFEGLAALEVKDHAGALVSPVRVLLLERHGEERKGWLSEVLAAEGVVRDTLRNECYLGSSELLPPVIGVDSSSIEATQRIVSETFLGWAAVTGRPAPSVPAFQEHQWREIQSRTGNRPLYLQMAAIHACERNSPSELPNWGRSTLLKSAVDREFDYIKSVCPSEDLRKALTHVAAILCLAGVGAARQSRRWNAIVAEELKGIGVSETVSVNQVEARRRGVFTAQAGDNEEMGLIQPDIVAEGFAATVLRDEEDPPTETLRQIVRLTGSRAWANLLRMVQDLVGVSGFERIDEWLAPLVSDASTEELQELSKLIPEHSTSLHGLGLLVNEELVRRIPDSETASRAECLLALGTHRHRLDPGDRKIQAQAESEVRESVRLFRLLDGDAASSHRRSRSKAHRALANAISHQERHAEAIRELWIAVHVACDEASAFTSESPQELDLSSLQTPVDADLMLELANALTNLAIEFRSTNDARREIATARRAVDIGRQLVEVNWTLYAPDLARYLNNLSRALQAAPMRKQAVSCSRESAVIREDLVRSNPDEYAHLLALSLETLVHLEYAEGNVSAARNAAERLIRAYEELASRNPGRYREEWAKWEHTIADLCATAGDTNTSLSHRRSALAIGEELVRSDFEKFAQAQWNNHHRFGVQLRKLGELAEAQAHFERTHSLGVEWCGKCSKPLDTSIWDNGWWLVKVNLERDQREQAQRWADLLVGLSQRSLPSDAGGKALALHHLTVSLSIVGDPRAAEMAVQAAASFRQERSESESAGNPTWVNASCNLSSALALYGDLTADETTLAEAAQVASEALDKCSSSTQSLEFTWGATLTNRGHALFRRGELLNRSDLVLEGIQALTQALAHHEALDKPEAAGETEALLRRARSALERMDPSHEPHE